MDKKKTMRNQASDDLKGFEEFLDHVDQDSSVDKVSKNIGGESLTFLLHDNTRLKKVAALVAQKIPVARSHDQGPTIIEQQRHVNAQLKNDLFRILDRKASPLQRTLADLWDGFFYDKKN
jgi:hypothetical protein